MSENGPNPLKAIALPVTIKEQFTSAVAPFERDKALKGFACVCTQAGVTGSAQTGNVRTQALCSLVFSCVRTRRRHDSL